ncbi:MAG: AMP-binding enzyme, partial [Acidimicrobiales bacterium]
DGHIIPVDQQGEICVRGYQVMLGYYSMPEETAAAIDRDGWLHTGDLATMDDRGYFTVTGRLKDLIIRGGENIYPREVEDLLFSHPKVAEVAVIGVSDAHWGEQVAAVIRPSNPADPPTAAELHDFCRSQLAPHKTPRFWYQTDQMPLTGSGKIQKYRIGALISDGIYPQLS